MFPLVNGWQCWGMVICVDGVREWDEGCNARRPLINSGIFSSLIDLLANIRCEKTIVCA